MNQYLETDILNIRGKSSIKIKLPFFICVYFGRNDRSLSQLACELFLAAGVKGAL